MAQNHKPEKHRIQNNIKTQKSIIFQNKNSEKHNNPKYKAIKA